MNAKRIIFVRIDERIEGAEFGPTDFDNHIEYLQNISLSRFFLGGGFVEKVGGMIIFEANNYTEANKIASEDPLIKRGLYTYELLQWDIVLKSKESFKWLF